ncbi:MAG: hypothetical protein ABI687_02280 [Flavitalea sp.]
MMKLIQPAMKKITVALLLLYVAGCNDPASVVNEETKQVIAVSAEEAVASDTINKPELVVPEVDGALSLTAQNGAASGPDIKYMPEWRAFGWFTAADRVDWEAAVQKAGEYAVQIEWSVSDEEAGKEFLLETNDQKLTGIVSSSGSWETYKTEVAGTIKLDAGRQKITFRSNKPFDKGAILDLRAIKLMPLK